MCLALSPHSGGPGCSGLLGFGAEHGPYHISGHGRLHDNKYSWNKIANMLYIEQPAGVGFSYTDSPDDKITGDAQSASDNFNLILQFLQKFPERQRNDFYLASESYGGHYIPQLALEILNHDPEEVINFRGFMVGNPYVDPFSNMYTEFEAYYSHGLLAKPLFDKWLKTCKDPEYYESKECDQITNHMFDEFGDGINPYALDYPVCNDVPFPKEQQSVDEIVRLRTATASKRRSAGLLEGLLGRAASNATVDGAGMDGPAPFTTSSSQMDTLLNNSPPFLPNQDQFKPCSQVYMERYVNNHHVRKALHVLDNAAYKWSPCGGVRYAKSDVDTPVIHLYKELVQMGAAGVHNLNMLVFSGDDDSICSTAGTQEWIWDLGVDALPGERWKPWKMHDQTVGFLTRYDLGANSTARFSFATIHGAGHEVPAYRPMEALEMFRKFLRVEW